jgi:hypothetical protein
MRSSNHPTIADTRGLNLVADIAPNHAFGWCGILCAIILLLCLATPGQAWVTLEQGLFLHTFPGDLQNAGITVLKIDPERYSLRLLTASEIGTGPLSLRDWAKRHDLSAVINASMYQQDRMTSTGYMRNFGHLNNPSINPRFGAFLLFNPKDSNEPLLRLVDRYHVPGWKSLLSGYHTVVQNYRMIGADRTNAWTESSQTFSMAGIGLDGAGNLLFIYSRFPRSVHQLNNILLNLPIDLKVAMYVEGGPVAGLYLNEERLAIKGLPGQTGSLWHELDAPHRVPNVLGITDRK